MPKKHPKERKDIRTRFYMGHVGYSGNKNGSWKGNGAGYHAIHQWLRTNFGRPYKCENKKCVYPRKNKAKKVTIKPKMFTWALLHGKHYIHKRENFKMLCMSCHAKYDKKIEKMYF